MAAKGVYQSTNKVLMVLPKAFYSNPEATVDNAHMKPSKMTDAETTRLARNEFGGVVKALRQAGIQVQVYEVNDDMPTPDAIFPNNWFSLHTPPETAERTLVLYPVKPANRRLERRADLIRSLRVGCSHVIDLTMHEHYGRYLESTGSFVLDRVNRIVYACASARTNIELLDYWRYLLGYRELVAFQCVEANGRDPVYHTNVMLSVGTRLAIICDAAIVPAQRRASVLASLQKTHEVMQISYAQMASFCANVLELRRPDGKLVLAMSSRAYHAFTAHQRGLLQRHYELLAHAPIETIENIGGGGVRCMLAEIFDAQSAPSRSQL